MRPLRLGVPGAPVRHEDAFLQRYPRLLQWACSLTRSTQSEAEDLVHEAFVHFVLTKPDLEAIENLDGYLRRVLQNLHLSSVRRSLRSPFIPLPILDYDSAALASRQNNQLRRLHVQGDLLTVCRYACRRMRTSRSASVLILRFFHGYYPGEIARILKSDVRAVDDWLRLARREARHALENGDDVSGLDAAADIVAPRFRQDTGIDGFLLELGRAILDLKVGPCVPDALEAHYQSSDSPRTTTTWLAHIVSCASCLDFVSHTLGLLPLADRYPTDTLGPGRRSSGGGAPGGGSSRPPILRLRRRLRDVATHRPKELRIAANGLPLGSQTVGAELNTQSVTASIGEALGFVEVFSEQNVRLLMLPVEAPPMGPLEQRARVDLDDDRWLEVSVLVCGMQPTVRAIYRDATLARGFLDCRDTDTQPAATPVAETRWLDGLRVWASAVRRTLGERRMRGRLVSRVRNSLTFSGRGIHAPEHSSPNFGLGTLVTAGATAFVLALALAVWSGRLPSGWGAGDPNGVDLLEAAAAGEQAVIRGATGFVHRTFTIEARSLDGGRAVERRRVEVWRDVESQATARRAYGEDGRLLSGEWVDPSSGTTVFRRGAAPSFTPQTEPLRLPAEPADLWLFEPSAAGVARLVQALPVANVTTLDDVYVVAFVNRPQAAANAWLIAARLKLRKADRRLIEAAWTARDTGVLREYRAFDMSLREVSRDATSPGIIQVDPEVKGLEAPRSPEPSSEPPPTASPAPLALEIEVLRRLHDAGACLGEQIIVSRTSRGPLRVDATVADNDRRRAVSEMLGSLTGGAQVELRVRTTTDASRPTTEAGSGSGGVRHVEVPGGTISAFGDVRRHVLERLAMGVTAGPTGSAESVDGAIHALAARIVQRSRQAVLQAWALRRLAAVPDVAGLGDDLLRSWQSMVRDHAREYREEVAALREELAPMFAPLEWTDANAANTAAESSAEVIERLLTLTTQQDHDVREAFTVSLERPASLAVRSSTFWNALSESLVLARWLEERQ